MLTHLSLPDVPDVARRTVSGALVLGVAALVAAVSLGHVLVGLGAAVGLAMGTLNFRMVGSSVSRAARRPDGRTRRPVAMNTVARMALITVLTLGLLVVSPQIGFGVLAGLAVFQVLLVVNVTRSILKTGRLAGGDVIDVDAQPVVDPRPEVE